MVFCSRARGALEIASLLYKMSPLSLSAGVRLGPYEIVSPLGSGGMGDVYRARDTQLGREVWLKVLPDAFSQDPDRLARFKREAQVLASLNHPHIAAIYAVQDEAPAELNDAHERITSFNCGRSVAATPL